ncbi:MAG: hypothetical protein EPN33_03025 [Acidobacteria bacterium]|nr:MAG: hypothetical protein EPN33_03025 [Acidobacteriota bacterium]
MNGGRLSNDETFLLGADELRVQLHALAPDAAAAERALARIGVRFPEEAEQLTGFWLGGQRAACEDLLRVVLAQHAADSED